MRKTFTYALTGGLDEISQPLAIAPGKALAALNHEVVEDGYARIDGFERFDGRTSPTDFPFYLLDFDAGVTAIVAGNTVTGATSGATGVALVNADLATGAWDGTATGTIALRSVTGTFQDNENLQVAAATVAVADGTTTAGQDLTGDTFEDSASEAAQDYARALITAVPGSGVMRGIVELGDVAYAFRNNAGGTAVDVYKSTTSGWTQVTLPKQVDFTSGGVTEIVEGNTITGATSGATAVVRRVVLQSGTWAAGTAAGYFVLSGVTGVFVAENLNVGASPNLATIAGAPSNITLPAGGRYFFVVHNFYAGSNTRRIYGANGVGTAFEFDGTYLVPLETGATTDTPERVAVFRNQLFLSFPNGLFQGSAVGDPVDWTVANGAWEGGIGSDIVDFIMHTESLVILGEDGVFVLTGYDRTDFALGPVTYEAGAKPYTAQRIGAGLYLDNRGLRSIATTQNYGNFAMGAISDVVKKTLKTKEQAGATPISSVIVRSKNHYRLFFSDGTGLSFYIGRKVPEPMYFDLDKVAHVIWSAEMTTGVERILFGDADGYVFQLDKGTSFDGETVQAFVQLAYAHCNSPNTLKRIHKVSFEATASAASDMHVSVEYDYSSNEQAGLSQTSVSAEGTGALWGVGNWGEFFWSSPAENVLEAYVDGQGRNASIIVVSDSADIAPYVLRGATIYYSERGAIR